MKNLVSTGALCAALLLAFSTVLAQGGTWDTIKSKATSAYKAVLKPYEYEYDENAIGLSAAEKDRVKKILLPFDTEENWESLLDDKNYADLSGVKEKGQWMVGHVAAAHVHATSKHNYIATAIYYGMLAGAAYGSHRLAKWFKNRYRSQATSVAPSQPAKPAAQHGILKQPGAPKGRAKHVRFSDTPEMR